MAELNELVLRLEELKKALHSGVLTVRHGETSTTYRSKSEIKDIIHIIENEIADLNEENKPKRVRYIRQTVKGY